MCKTFLTFMPIFSDTLIFTYLANFGHKLLLFRLTLWWREMNLIGRLFVVGSPGRRGERFKAEGICSKS